METCFTKVGLKTSAIVCFVLITSIFLYYLPFKWIIGWHTDPWLIEASFLLLTFILCDAYLTIFLSKNLNKHFNYPKYINYLRKPYFVTRTFVTALFAGKLVLTFFLALLPYGSLVSVKILPEVRFVDHHLTDSYYLDYSDKKGILITRKVGFLEKDIQGFFCQSNNDIRYTIGKDNDSLKAYEYKVFPKECFVKRGDTTFFTSKYLARESIEKCIYCDWGGCKYCIDYSSKFRKQSISYFKDKHFLIIRCNTMDHGSASTTASGTPNRYVEHELKINLIEGTHEIVTY